MKRINQLDEIPTLGLPLDVEITLTDHLLTGFIDKQEADSFWLEYSTHLILIEPCDTEIDIDKIDTEEGYWINFIINNPEYVLLLGTTEPYLLALGIVDTAGAGSYYLSSADHPSQHAIALKNHLNNQTNKTLNNHQIGA